MGLLNSLFGGVPASIRGKIYIEDIMLQAKQGDSKTMFRTLLPRHLGAVPGLRLFRLFDAKQQANSKQDADTIIQLKWDLLLIGFYRGTTQQAFIVLCEVCIINNKPAPVIINRKLFKGLPPDKVSNFPLQNQWSIIGEIPWAEIEKYIRSIPVE